MVIALALVPERMRASVPCAWERVAPAIPRDVARAIAERWHVAPERVRLDWMSGCSDGRGDSRLTAAASVRVAGDGASADWTIIIAGGDGGAPLTMRVRAGVEERLPLAARALPRETALAESDIVLDSASVRWGPPRDRGATPGVGWVTRRLVNAGEPLREPTVGKPIVVKHGEPVEVVYGRGAVLLRVRGTAVGSASVGERVGVRMDNGRRIDGVAAGAALVRID